MTNCKKCGKNFEVTNNDLTYYKTIEVTPPTLCPDCRQQRRLAWRNERSLYKRKCDLCTKDIISIYAPDSPFKVYCSKCWWSDNWDPLEYSMDFDSSRPFFEQWHELNVKTPKLTLINDNNSRSINCEYTNDFAFGKNCYMVFCSWHQESCMYSHFANRTNFSSDVTACLDSELLYECVDCEHGYNSTYLINSSNCHDCHFGYDLKNCSNCLLSYGLRGKQYHIHNEPYSKEEYEKIVKELQMSSYKSLEKLYSEFLGMLTKASRKHLNLKNCHNCIGDYLVNCKNVFLGYDFHNAEDSKFIYMGDTTKNSYDICNTGNSELCYENITSDDSYQSRFTIFSWKNRFVTYTNDCHSCENVFGCVSLKKGKYCILNKQYSKEVYEQLVAKIIQHMIANKEWGEFFPIDFSPFAYNETVAQEYYPLIQEAVEQQGWNWKKRSVETTQNGNVIFAESLPDTIDEVTNEILDQPIKCVSSGRFFRITEQELQFYRKQNLPLPRLHPDERHKRRASLRNPRTMFARKCAQCHQEIQSSYSPERPERVLCEKCYLAEVY